jgi:hypothetical protein
MKEMRAWRDKNREKGKRGAGINAVSWCATSWEVSETK